MATFNLPTNSPCVNSGDNGAVAVSTDLGGNPRMVGSYVDVGAYEVQSALPPVAAVKADYTNLTPNFVASLSARLDWGRATGADWDFGDGTSASNILAVTHAW